MFTGMFEHITSYKVVTQVIFFQVKKICGKVSSEQNLSETFVVGIIFHFIFIPNKTQVESVQLGKTLDLNQ